MAISPCVSGCSIASRTEAKGWGMDGARIEIEIEIEIVIESLSSEAPVTREGASDFDNDFDFDFDIGVGNPAPRRLTIPQAPAEGEDAFGGATAPPNEVED